MREIKFRAWVVDEYGNDGNTPKTFKMCLWDKYFFYDTSPVTGWSGEFPYLGDPCVTLMQFTGRQDSEGVDAYEGDVIEMDFGVQAVIRWNSRYDAWTLLTRDTATICVGLVPVSKYVIVGNIYENPELGYG